MASKLSGRDLNGMRAAGWSRPNLAAIKSVKVDKNCTNDQLLVAIRKIVCESVTQLRGTNADDKYRNIVDMLMLRIRGALATAVEQIEENQTEVDTSEIAQSVSDTVTQLVESKIDPKNGLILISKDSLKLLADEIVNAIGDAASSACDDADEEEDQKEDQHKQASSDDTAKDDMQKSGQARDKSSSQIIAPAAYSSPATANVASAQQVTPADVDKLRVQLNESFEKIESLMQSTAVVKQMQNDATKIDVSNAKVAKTAKDANDKLSQKTSVAPNKKDAAKQKKSSKLSDVLSGKQFSSLMKTLAKYQQKVISSVTDVADSMAQRFQKLNKVLDKIYDKLNAKKISWLAIIAGLSLIIIPLFWNKIRGFFLSISQKFDLKQKINDAISNLLSSIDWNGHVSAVISKVWEAVKNAFKDFIQNPFDSVVTKFKGAYEAITQWTKDIWAYIKEKLSWTKQKQDENEQKAEKASTEQFQAAMGKLEQHTDTNVKQAEANVNAACDATSADITQKTTAVSEDVQKMQQDTTQQITSTTQDVADSQSNISNVMLPKMSQDMERSVDSAEQKCNGKTDAAIKASESKLNSALDDLDKTIKENGAPTDVSKETIKQMDAAGEGSRMSSGDIDASVKGPATVMQTAVEEQGKTTSLYVHKDDVKRAADEGKEISQIAGTESAVPNVTNINNTSNTAQAKFESKIMVNGTGGITTGQAKLYEDMNAVMNEASRNCVTVENGLSRSQKSLDALSEKVNDYFSQLNCIAKAIQDKPPAQQNNNVLMMSGSQTDDVCMEGL